MLRLSLLAASIVCGLLIAELGLRMAGYSPAFINAMGSFHDSKPVTGHRGTPNFRGRFKTPQFDVMIVHDAAGFRQQEFQKPATAGRTAWPSSAIRSSGVGVSSREKSSRTS